MCECAFCQIINRKSPAHIIYENGQLISFLDIEPINEGHAHFHVFPRYDSDGFGWTYGRKVKDVNEEIAERIRKKLENSL